MTFLGRIRRRPRADVRTRAQRIYLILFGVIVGLVVLTFVWILVTGLLARSRLNAAEHEVPALKRAITAGDLSHARALADKIAGEARTARRLTAGPAWWTVANLPVAGSPLRTVRALTGQVQRVSAQAPALLDAAATLLQTPDGGTKSINTNNITTATVGRVTTSLNAATVASRRAAAAVAGSDASWLPVVSRARTRVLRSLQDVNQRLVVVNRAAGALTPLLGLTRPQTFFVGFMNEAEARGLGGLPGAFAILTVDRGRFRFTHFGSDTEFHKVHTGLDLGAEYDARYSQDDPANEYANSDISPDLRDAARIWSAMWQQKSGQHIDGVAVLDPTTLSYLLKVTGPATLADGTRVGASNVVALTQSTVYAEFASDARSNAYLRSIAAAAAKTLTGAGGRTPLRLVSALATATEQRRFAIWSADTATEKRIVGAGYGAVLEPSPAFTGFTVVNAGGNKLDYYLDRRMTYRPTSCAAGSTARATFTLTNNAPRSGLPTYVTLRNDQHPANVRPGDNRVLVTYYASPGAGIVSVTVDGKPVGVSTAPEKGLVATTVDVELPVGTSRTLTVVVREPSPSGPLSVLKQPLVRPEVTDIDRRCTAGR